MRERDQWRLYEGAAAAPSVTVRISADDAWRLFYNAVDLDRGESILQIEGDRELGLHLLGARSVMV